MKIQHVANLVEAFEALNGLGYTLDGIHGHFKIETLRKGAAVGGVPEDARAAGRRLEQ